MNLGRLVEVNVRELWKHEQHDFSNWLAKEENIELLNEAIGLNITEVMKEVFVGSYRCDLVAKDEITGIRIIIENQLESTNHDHLGKLITYASGLDAEVIVWIVKEAREEHISAIEWLNNKTTNDVSFFLIELHAYQIGDSIPAPKLEVIEKPNDFVKSSRLTSKDGTLSRSKSERLMFWTEFNEMIESRGKPFNIRKATTDHWYNVAIGSSEAYIMITLVNKNNSIGVEVYIDKNKELFDRLYLFADEIHNSLGFTMDWQRLNDKKASRIISYIPGLNFDCHDNYQQLMNETIDKVKKIKSVFQKYIK